VFNFPGVLKLSLA